MITITDNHRAVLSRRSETGKMGMPLHCDLLQPWVLVVMFELSVAKLIECVSHRLPMDHPIYGRIFCDIYKLTDAGEKLCADHDILAIKD